MKFTNTGTKFLMYKLRFQKSQESRFYKVSGFLHGETNDYLVLRHAGEFFKMGVNDDKILDLSEDEAKFVLQFYMTKKGKKLTEIEILKSIFEKIEDNNAKEVLLNNLKAQSRDVLVNFFVNKDLD